MTLIRSGVSRIRVIDYDIVTLSSLNRHAFAFRTDVGKLKVRVVKEYCNKINPNVTIEPIDDAFLNEYANKYILSGNPDYVIDCIDDLEAKCDLLKFCNDHKLRVISSMGAGAKCDPSAIRVADFHFVQGDKLAKRLRYMYKKRFGSQIPNFQTIFSIEKTTRNLTDLDDHQKENPEVYRINDNERVRSLPVFASIPAIFGQAISAVVLCNIANMPISFNTPEEEKLKAQEEMIGNITIKKLYEEFKNDESKKKTGMTIEKSSTFELFYEDFVTIAKAFNYASSISQKPGNKVKFSRWDASIPPTIDNIVLMSKSESNKHFELKNESDLKTYYGEDIFKRIKSKLDSLKQNK